MTQNINLSTKIKITIPNDPVFSGIYVFDRDEGNGDSFLQSDNWVLNSGESTHNLIPYNNPGSLYDGKMLVSFNDNLPGTNNNNYQGYVELKTQYNQILNDAFAFPAQFAFTATQRSIESGHRLAVGFALPIRWRGSSNDWVVVDQVSHRINDVIDYTTGAIFSDGVAGGTNLNSKPVQYTESWTPGTLGAAGNSPTGGYITISNDSDHAIWPICTGLPDLGFAFRVSASGLGLNEQTGENDHSPLEGLGNGQNFTPDFGSPDARDTSNFFGDKIPVIADINFIYSCRPGRLCVNLTPNTVSPIQVSGICFSKSTIISNLFCGNIQDNPSQSVLDSYGVSSISIVYSGVSVAYPAIKEPLGHYYDVYKTNIDSPIIELLHESTMPYTGIMDLISNRISVVEHWMPEADPANYKYFAQYSDIELVWNVDAQNQKATVYIIPDLDAPYHNTTILVCGSDMPQVNGKYYWNNLNKIFSHSPVLVHDDALASSDFHIVGQSFGISAKWILGSGNFDINNNSMWNPNSMDPLEWKTYYTLNDNIFSETTQSWSIDQDNVGTNPPPSSVTYCTIPRTCDPVDIPAIEALYAQLSTGEAKVSYDNGSTWEDLPGNPISLYNNNGMPTDTLYIDSDFAILGGTFMTQGSCKWSERNIGPYAGNNTVSPVHLVAASSYGVINYFDDTNTNIYAGIPSNDVKSWTEYEVFNNPDQSEDLTNIVAHIVFQSQVITTDYVLSVLSIRFQTNYQYQSPNITSWNNYYIYFDITDGKFKFTTTQPSAGSAGSVPYKIVIIKNIMFILDETYTVTATYSSNGSCYAVSLDRLLGNTLSGIASDPSSAIITTLECINDISFVELDNNNIKVFIATQKGLFSNEYGNFDESSLLDTIQNTFFCDSLDFDKGSWTQSSDLTQNTTFVKNETDGVVLAIVNGNLWISYNIGQSFTMILQNQGVKNAFISNKINFNDCRSQSCSECADSNGGWDTTGGIFTWVPSSITMQSTCVPACGGDVGIPPYLMVYNGTPSMQNFYESRACNTCDSRFIGYVSPDNATGEGTNPALGTIYTSGDIGKYYLTLTSGVYGGVSYNAGVYLMVDAAVDGTVGIVELPIYDPEDPSLTDAATNMCRPPCGEDCLWEVVAETSGYSPTKHDGYDFYNCSYYSIGGSWVQAENFPGINEFCIPPAVSASSVAEGYLYPGSLLYWLITYNADPDCCDCVHPTIIPTINGEQVSTPATRLSRLEGI